MDKLLELQNVMDKESVTETIIYNTFEKEGSKELGVEEMISNLFIGGITLRGEVTLEEFEKIEETVERMNEYSFAGLVEYLFCISCLSIVNENIIKEKNKEHYEIELRYIDEKCEVLFKYITGEITKLKLIENSFEMKTKIRLTDKFSEKLNEYLYEYTDKTIEIIEGRLEEIRKTINV